MNKTALLKKLDTIEYNKDDKETEESLEQLDVADSIARLAGLKNDNEYKLCRQAAKHTLGEIPEPDDEYLQD